MDWVVQLRNLKRKINSRLIVFEPNKTNNIAISSNLLCGCSVEKSLKVLTCSGRD
jgi:hypothetical protein